MSKKDYIRAIFKIPVLEKLLSKYTRNKIYGSGATKLTPNHYSYKNPAIRNVKRNDVRFRLNISNIVDWNIYFGFYEASRENLFHLVDAPKTILDIGANIGEISLRFAQLNPQANIHSFEPFPDTFRVLKHNSSLNPFTNIQIHPIGLGSRQGTVFFEERAAGNPGMNRVTSNPEKSSKEIEITTLDTWMANNKIREVSLIKIDVEGYELEVLKGAATVLAHHKPILFIELDDDNLRDQGSSALELIQYIHSFGYQTEHAEHGTRIDENSILNHIHYDIICKPIA